MRHGKMLLRMSEMGQGLPPRQRWRRDRCTPDSRRLIARHEVGRLGPITEVATTRLALVLGEGHVHHELAFGRMPRNVPLARRILSEHDAPRGEAADVAVACLKFNLAG